MHQLPPDVWRYIHHLECEVHNGVELRHMLGRRGFTIRVHMADFGVQRVVFRCLCAAATLAGGTVRPEVAVKDADHLGTVDVDTTLDLHALVASVRWPRGYHTCNRCHGRDMLSFGVTYDPRALASTCKALAAALG